ncbi:MAG: chromosomal replication initiation protein DnaA [Candidatus Saccharibacteria bacterium]|nr:chromosomal replication initiation protein DnaA [Candidatus Saccharibacteria bacterium]
MQKDSLWQAVLGEIELSVSRGNYVTYFKNTRLLKYDAATATIGVPNVFLRGTLERKYAGLIRETLLKNGIAPTSLEFTVSSAPKSNRDKEEEADEVVFIPSVSAAPQTAGAPAPNQASPNQGGMTGMPRPASGPMSAPGSGMGGLSHSYRQGINERYTFDNFIVGSGNELAFAACQSIAQQPGRKYNPLFLYGGVGIGKTHLIQAVGNAVLAQNPRARVLYVTTEQFVQEFVDALRFRKTADFAAHYRTADVLIVDDVQFIAGKEKMQEEFFHTFNALHQANCQIILSSDKPPKEIPTLEDRLRSRFAWGMSIDMQIPDFETRCAIVQTKAQTHNVVLNNEVVEYLANSVTTNIRELEGALNQLLAFCEMRGLEPSLSIVSSVISAAKTRPKHLSAKQIIERTARHFQVPIEDMLGPKRDKDIVVPRQIAMYMLRSELHLSFPKIARELGRKDHTTAIHSVEKIEKESKLDADLRSTLSEIKERLYA